MVELSVDEMSIVSRLPHDDFALLNIENWASIAEYIIKKIDNHLGLTRFLGAMMPEKRAPASYTVAYKFGEHQHYMAIAYHPLWPKIGVILNFSARAFDYYCEMSGYKPYEILQFLQNDYFDFRISKIDLACDFIDEAEINDVSSIYQGFIDNSLGIFKERIDKDGETNYSKINLSYQGIIKRDEVPTLYVGAMRSNARLKLYDKKREQEETNGSYLLKAKSSTSWIRGEITLRNTYSSQITEELLNTSTDNEFANIIASTFVQKFRLMYVDKGVVGDEHEFTSMLLGMITNNNFVLKSPSSRNYDLRKSILYLFKGSGVATTMYKISEIWGVDAVLHLFEAILEHLENYSPNDDCRYWLNFNLVKYRKNHPDFYAWFGENIATIIN